MGIFDFRRNKNIKNDNGLNEVYFEQGKSKQLNQRFYRVNGKIDGLIESFYENGKVKNKSYWKDGIQNGKAKTYNHNGDLIRESNFENGEYIGTTKEFYPNNKLRLEIYVNDNKHVVYGKDGVKKFEIFFKYQESNIKISRSYRPPSYSSNVWGEVRVGYSSPFGKWIVYRNSKKDYELDFRLAEKYGSSIEFAIRNNFDESETVTSSEALEITKFNDHYINDSLFHLYRRNEVNERINSNLLYDYEPSLIGDILEFKTLSTDDISENFIKTKDNPFVYAFTYESCAEKLMFNTIMLNGGFNSFKLNFIDKKNNKQVWNSDSVEITLEKKKGVYKISISTWDNIPIDCDQEYILTVKINQQKIKTPLLGDFQLSIENFIEKMKKIPDWYDIVQKRGEGHAMFAKSMGIKVDDYEYWANAHKGEYLVKYNEGNLDIEGIRFRIEKFGYIVSELEIVIKKAAELKLNITHEMHHDYCAARASVLGAEYALKEMES